ncbi:hypothetical protein [Agromyces sp. NPDC058126]|uniref:hypothetical protein n=1 Tax=Agromyces sp. NPDC058126 TaxID=3346350 RepID=UPI0036DB6348
MGQRSPAGKFVVYAAMVGVLLAGAWGATLLLPPNSPANEADAMHEVTELYARIDSTLRPGDVHRRADQTTSAVCPREGHGSQSTLERDYRLNESFVPDRWLDVLEAEFPASADWYIKITAIGNSEGRRIRLVGRSLLAVEMTLVGDGSDQRLRLIANSRCYPTTPNSRA